jgi:hypothetical protein
MPSHFGYAPSTEQVRLLDVGTQENALREMHGILQRAAIHPDVVTIAKQITQNCASRDDKCELLAIFDAVRDGNPDVAPLRSGVRYVRDPRWADYFTSPVDLLRQCMTGACAEDCLPSETLVLGAGYKFRRIGDLKPGDLIMGDGQWTRVTRFWDKGEQDIIEIRLNNGSTLRCTPSHKLFRVPNRNGYAGDRAGAEEVLARDIALDDDLLVPGEFAAGVESLAGEQAWMLGAYIADGWVGYSEDGLRPIRANLSGLDGWRKEVNKVRAEAYYAARGLPTRWAEKYLAINDAAEAEYFAACGRRAIDKHVPSLNFDKATITHLLSGLAADADVRDGVFSTISHELALQLRVMLRMVGQSSHIVRIDDHGGLGKNPIYRVTPRAVDDNRRRFARVKGISVGQRTHTVDIEVEGHRFYLPETDLISHNCDGHALLVAALAAALGWKVGLRAYGEEDGFSHVYAVVAFPKLPVQSGKHLVWEQVLGLDTTVPRSVVGWEPPRANVLTAWLE